MLEVFGLSFLVSLLIGCVAGTIWQGTDGISRMRSVRVPGTGCAIEGCFPVNWTDEECLNKAYGGKRWEEGFPSCPGCITARGDIRRLQERNRLLKERLDWRLKVRLWYVLVAVISFIFWWRYYT